MLNFKISPPLALLFPPLPPPSSLLLLLPRPAVWAAAAKRGWKGLRHQRVSGILKGHQKGFEGVLEAYETGAWGDRTDIPSLARSLVRSFAHTDRRKFPPLFYRTSSLSDLPPCINFSRGRPKAVFVFGTEDQRLMNPAVPKITEDCRRPKTEG